MFNIGCLKGCIKLIDCLLPKHSTWQGHTGINHLLLLFRFMLGASLEALQICVISNRSHSFHFLSKSFARFYFLVLINFIPLKWLQSATFNSLLYQLSLNVDTVIWEALLSLFFSFWFDPRLIAIECFLSIKFWIERRTSKKRRSFVTSDSSCLKYCMRRHYLLRRFWAHELGYFLMPFGIGKWIARTTIILSCSWSWFLSKSICSLD